jgi:hypothetical protein
METLLTAIFVCGIVWGGVIIILRMAIKFEKKKRENQI